MKKVIGFEIVINDNGNLVCKVNGVLIQPKQGEN